MKNEQQLQPVARVAKSQERNAARVMSEMLRQTEAQQTQLNMLIDYREKYFQKFSRASKVGLSAIQMRGYQAFLSRLDTAIEQQQQQVAQSHQSCEQSKSDWRGRHNHSEMINKIVEKRKHQAQQERNSREQRELDDRSAANFVGNKK